MTNKKVKEIHVAEIDNISCEIRCRRDGENDCMTALGTRGS